MTGRFRATLLALVLLGLTGCAVASPAPAPAPGPTSTSLAWTLPAAHAGVAMPDPSLTPGVVDPALTASTICAPGFSTKSIRNVTEEEKRQVYAEYHLAYPQPSGAIEVDHLISLELGGSNDLRNLWLQPASPKPGFHEKDDVLENQLHELVCSGRLQLADAQKAITSDWYAAYTEYVTGGGGGGR